MDRLLLLPVLLVLVPACTRRATPDDCHLIVDRSVELRLAERGGGADAATVEKRKVELRRELEGELTSCVGRRVTQRMMDCVRMAATSNELTSCLR